MKRILFYSSLKSKRGFVTQGFYKTDIQILRDLNFEVKLSIHWYDFLLIRNYDICFIYFYRYGAIPAFIGKVFGKKVFFTGGIDDLDPGYATKKGLMIQRLLFKICNLLSNVNILVSTSDKKNIQLFSCLKPAEKFPLSFHVIDFERYKYSNNIKKEKIILTIVWMGSQGNVLRKGVDKSIHVFEKIVKIDSEYKMLIIGTIGDGTIMIKNLIAKYGLENKVILTGQVDDNEKIAILKKSKFYFQLSSYEGFGVAAVEALASGCIVVHSGKGGLIDGIGDYGLKISDVNDYDNICDIVLNQDQDSCVKLINNGIKHVFSNFRYEKRYNDFYNIFKFL